MCHAIVASCKCLSCKRGHVNERHKSASSCVPSWLPCAQPGNESDTKRSLFSWLRNLPDLYQGHSGDFGNAAKMVGKMSKSVMQLISIGF